MDKMCVYCEGIFSPDTYVCSTCDEYKGLMLLVDAVEYLGLDYSEFPELRHS
jgi:RNA polymerase subunit RPABC4/transcription elongation factor Spt4